MTNQNSADKGSAGNTAPSEESSALFASLVMQQVNMAAMLLGQGHQPDPEKPIRDLEAARLFIDHLEVLSVKTKGNLTTDEEHLLNQSLTNLRLAYVYAVEEDGKKPSPSQTVAPKETEKPTAPPEGQASAAAESEESRKKFSKKY